MGEDTIALAPCILLTLTGERLQRMKHPDCTTLHSRGARKYPRPAPGVQAPQSSGGATEPDSLRVAQENAIRRARSTTKSKRAPRLGCSFAFGGATRIRTGDKGFADPCLTTWPWRRVERITGLEPATSTLARSRSTK